jgi:hypothetical protein
MTIDTDLFVVVGILIASMAFPSAIGAYAERRFPYVALLVIAIGAVLVGMGAWAAPNGYSLGRVPHSFVEILARVLN